MSDVVQTIRTEQQLPAAVRWVHNMLARGIQSGEVVITLGRTRRTNSQNSKLWPMLDDVALQCELLVNGHFVKASSEDWKDIFTANLYKQSRLAIGIDGELVYLGHSTSKMNKAQFSELIELIYSYGAQNGIVWSEPALRAYEEYR